jgi:hypothetical protein
MLTAKAAKVREGKSWWLKQTTRFLSDLDYSSCFHLNPSRDFATFALEVVDAATLLLNLL